jgi:hypothetical protein
MNLLEKDRLKDKRIFIVAAGASLKEMDLELMHNDEKILCNRTVEHCLDPWALNMTWVWNDMHYLPDINEYQETGFLKHDGLPFNRTVIGVEMGVRPDWKYQMEQYKGIYDKFKYRVPFDCSKSVNEGNFSYDIEDRTYCGWTVVLDLAIPLAMWWGCNPIYLIGCDTEHTGHFNGDYKFSNPETINLMLQGYQVVRRYADSFGFPIINVGIGGKLDAFLRAEYKELF